jgi:hypothetical protein
MTVSTVGVSVAGSGVCVGIGVSVTTGAGVVAEITVATVSCALVVTSAVKVGVGVGEGVTGVLVGRTVLVGMTTQETGVGSMLSKVGQGVRVGRVAGPRCFANWVKAVLKIT